MKVYCNREDCQFRHFGIVGCCILDTITINEKTECEEFTKIEEKDDKSETENAEGN